MPQKIEGMEWVSAYEAGQMLECDYWEIKRRVEAGELQGKESPYGLMVLLVGDDVAEWDKEEEEPDNSDLWASVASAPCPTASPEPSSQAVTLAPAPTPTAELPTVAAAPTPNAERPAPDLWAEARRRLQDKALKKRANNRKPRTRKPVLDINPKDSDIGKTVTGPEARAILNISRGHLSRLLEDGRLNGWKEGSRWRIMLDDVERYRLAQQHWKEQGGRWTICGRLPYIGGRSDNSERVENWRGSRDQPPHAASSEELAAGDRWITRAETAAILALTLPSVVAYEKRGRLHPRREHRIVEFGNTVRRQHKVCYLLSEVLALQAYRDAKAWRRATSPGKWRDGPTLKPLIRTKLEAPPGDRLISRREAATILGVTLPHISALVAEGKLFGWQELPGRPGSRLLLSERQVIRRRDDPVRQAGLSHQFEAKRRGTRPARPAPDDDDEEPSAGRWYQPTCRYQRGKERPKPVPILPGWQENFQAVGFDWRANTPATERDHGEYFTARQVGKLLGVGRTAVRKLQKSGRLNAYRRPLEPARGNGNRWYFYKKADVYALLEDSDYLRAHKRGVQAWATRRQRS